MQRRLRAVLRELADRELDQRTQGLIGVQRAPVRRVLVNVLQPRPRDSGGGEQDEDAKLAAGDLLPARALLSDLFECALEGEPQGGANSIRIFIAVQVTDTVLQRVLPEPVQIGGETALAALDRCRRLRDRHRQIAEGVGNGVRRIAVGLASTAEQHGDRLLALEDPHADGRPVGLLPIHSLRRRSHDP